MSKPLGAPGQLLTNSYCTSIAIDERRRIDWFGERMFRLRRSDLEGEPFPARYEIPFAIGRTSPWPKVEVSCRLGDDGLVIATRLLEVVIRPGSDEFVVRSDGGRQVYPSKGPITGLFRDGYSLFDSASAFDEVNENSRHAHWFYSEQSDCYADVALEEDALLDRFFIYGPDYPSLFRQYRELTGAAPVPPKKSFGYMQTQHLMCRGNQDKLLRVAREMRSRRIPCDTLIIDFEWGDGCSGQGDGVAWGDRLEWSSAYSAPRSVEEMLEELRKDHFDVLLIHHSVPDFESRWNQGWTGKAYPPEVWWNALEEKLRLGVRGTWQDTRRNDITNDQIARGLQQRLGSNQRALMITNYDTQDVICWSRKHYPVAQANGIGTHRYPIHWTGDCDFTWRELRWQVRAICGDQGAMKAVPYLNSDTIGRNWKLLTRWRQFTALCPIARSHHTKPWNDGEDPNEQWLAGFEEGFAWEKQEPLTAEEERRSRSGQDEAPADWSDSGEDAIREAHELRYRLLPYIYGLALENYRSGMPLVRPLYVDFPDDPRARDVPLEYMFGPSLLVAPVCADQDTWDVYLPEGAAWFELGTGLRHLGGREVRIDCSELSKIPVFVREGHIVPTMPLTQWVDAASGSDTLELLLHGTNPQTGSLLEDDGESLAYQAGGSSEWTFGYDGTCLRLAAVPSKATWVPEQRLIRCVWSGLAQCPRIDGIQVQWDGEAGIARFELTHLTRGTSEYKVS